MYKRVVTKGHLPFCYLKVKLEFENEYNEPDLEAATFKFIITQAVKSLHGEICAGHDIDVLKYQRRKLEAILRVHHSFLTKLWSSLTLHNSYQGQSCAFRVLQVSSHLMSLSANSREIDVT